MTQAATAPATPELAASWRPLEPSRVGAEYRVVNTGGDDEEDAVTATSPRAQSADESAYSDDDGPRWPDENEEAAVLAERTAPATIREQIDHAEAERLAEEAESVRDLPALEELVERLPAAVREGLEDLFRAKYTKVRRLPARMFNRPPTEGG